VEQSAHSSGEDAGASAQKKSSWLMALTVAGGPWGAAGAVGPVSIRNTTTDTNAG